MLSQITLLLWTQIPALLPTPHGYSYNPLLKYALLFGKVNILDDDLGPRMGDSRFFRGKSSKAVMRGKQKCIADSSGIVMMVH